MLGCCASRTVRSTRPFPPRRPATVRELLTFTFGFGAAFEMYTSSKPWPIVTAADELRLGTFGPPNPAQQPDPDTWITALGSLPLIAQPGERWLDNTGASVLGVLLSRAAGRPFGELLRSRVFEPLGMGDTALWTSEVDRPHDARGRRPGAARARSARDDE